MNTTVDLNQIGFGLLKPPDKRHSRRYVLENLPLFSTVPPLGSVEKILYYPKQFVKDQDQGRTPQCAAYAGVWQQIIFNSTPAEAHRYYCQLLYDRAQRLDGIPGSHEGTTLRAIGEALMQYGLAEVVGGKAGPEKKENGITGFYWAANAVNAVRSALGLPDVNGVQQAYVAIAGTDWHRGMLSQQVVNGERWILRGVPADGDLGDVVGGHAYTIIGCSDSIDDGLGGHGAFKILNSWGEVWPPAWISWKHFARLTDIDGGEVMFSFDYKNPPAPTIPQKFVVKGNVNLRSGPGTMYPIIATLDAGDGPFPIAGTELDSNGKVWYLIAKNQYAAAYVASWVVTPQ